MKKPLCQVVMVCFIVGVSWMDFLLEQTVKCYHHVTLPVAFTTAEAYVLQLLAAGTGTVQQ